MFDPREQAIVDASVTQREAVAKVHARMAAQQRGEAFQDLDGALGAEGRGGQGRRAVP